MPALNRKTDGLVDEGDGTPSNPPEKKTKDTQGPSRRQDTEKRSGPKRPVVWKRPSPQSSALTSWPQVDRELRGKPGQWALVATPISVRAAKVQTSRLRCGEPRRGQPRRILLEIGAFEIERRGREVYARFIGDAEAVAS